MSDVIVGIDAGTTSVKSVVFGLDGKVLGLARSSLHVRYGAGNAVELDMDDVWRSVVTTFRAAMDEVPNGRVTGIGVTGQGDGAWLLDRHGRPVREAALWLDGRAVAIMEKWQGGELASAILAATGSALFPGALPPLLAYLAEDDPALHSQVAHHLNCKDWIKYRLTGEKVTDPSEASRTFLNVGSTRYSRHAVEAFGMEGLLEILPPIAAPTEVAGTLTSQAARELGIQAQVPVVNGLVDTAATGLGLGASGDHDSYIILGTTAFVGKNQPSREHVHSQAGILLETGRGSQVLESLSTMSGTPNLDWARNILGLAATDWDVLEERAAAVPPGARGIHYLPYSSPNGERAPFVAPEASAGWLGTHVTTRPEELLRAVYEGVCLSLADCLDHLGESGSRVNVGGGGAQSDLLCQILADATGRTVSRPDSTEAGARGVAMLALAATHQGMTLEEAEDTMRPRSRSFLPRNEIFQEYDNKLDVLRSVRSAIHPLWSHFSTDG